MRRFGILGAFALSGCAVGPNYHKPHLIIPSAYKITPGWMQAQPADGMPKGAWWTAFRDADLNQLEPLVAVNNASLAADYYAYKKSVEIVQEARGSFFPTLGLSGSVTRAGDDNSSNSFNNAGPTTAGTFEGGASWTPDIWGKIRRQVEGNAAAAQVSAADLDNAKLSAQAQLADDYVNLRTADANITLFQKTVVAYTRSLQITQNQYNAGSAAELDVITAQTQLEGAQSQLVGEGAARAQYEHAIATLIGEAPSEVSISAGQQIVNAPVPPPGVPSALLERRPDIAAAERTMAEENAQIGVAVGAYYPDLTLSALGGYSADPIDGLLSVSNALWSLGADASDNLFEGGMRSASVRAAKFGYDEAVQNYRQTVLTAFQDVETDLSSLRIYSKQARIQAKATAAAARAVQIALNEYQAGAIAYTTVVTAQVTLLSDQEEVLTIQQNRLLASIALYQDLGGGFSEADLPSVVQIQAKLPFIP